MDISWYRSVFRGLMMMALRVTRVERDEEGNGRLGEKSTKLYSAQTQWNSHNHDMARPIRLGEGGHHG